MTSLKVRYLLNFRAEMANNQLKNDTIFVKQLRVLLLKFMNDNQQSQNELSQTLGLGRWQISRYMSEDYLQVPSRETLCKILEVTGTELRLTFEHRQPDGQLETRTEVLDLNDPKCPLPTWFHHRLRDYMDGRHPNPIHKRCSKRELYQMLEINKMSFETFYDGRYTADLSLLARLLDFLQVIPSFVPRPSLSQPLPQQMVADEGEEL